MFARWSQENFFRYIRQSYNLDGLVDYGTDIVPDATMVVNPAYRTLDGQALELVYINRKIAEFGAVNLEGEIEPCEVEAFTQRKSICRKHRVASKRNRRAPRLCEKPPNDIFRIKSCHRTHGSIA